MYTADEMEKKYTTKQASEKTGLSIDTLRYYEKIGLIYAIKRQPNGHRLYCKADLIWIDFLKQLRETGMPIAQMKRFAELRKGGEATVTERREALEAHRAELTQKIKQIEAFMTVIDAKIAKHKASEQSTSFS